MADKLADQALADLEAQRAVATRYGLLDRMASPKEDEAVMAADCALHEAPIVMTRIAGDDLPAFSGWMLACAEDHDHGERHVVSVRTAAKALPAIVPYLALPRGAAVLLGAGSPAVFFDGKLCAPRSYPAHTYLGCFTLGARVLITDPKEDPPLALSLRCVSGRWHAWVRTGREGAHVALMAVHEDHLDRANDEPVAFGGDEVACVAVLLRASKVTPTSDWRKVENFLYPHTWELVELAAKNHGGFVARWGGGPIAVGICDEATQGDATLVPGEGAAGMLERGCYARTTTADNWSVYGVEEDDRAVVLRVRLTADDDHVYLVDKKSAGATLAAPPAAANARKYTPSERFAVGEVVVHAKFGAGRVASSSERYVEIAFEVGVKKLAQALK